MSTCENGEVECAEGRTCVCDAGDDVCERGQGRREACGEGEDAEICGCEAVPGKKAGAHTDGGDVRGRDAEPEKIRGKMTTDGITKSSAGLGERKNVKRSGGRIVRSAAVGEAEQVEEDAAQHVFGKR